MLKYEIVTEGKVNLFVSKGKISKELPVFYNPAKEFDRDLSILFLKAVKKKTVLDLLCASGARGIRLAKEAGAKVTYNDVSAEAIKVLKKNLKLNKLEKSSKIFNMTANNFLGQCSDKFDFIDIDPFGSPILFIFNSIKRLDKDGYLAVTATDTAPLYGLYKWTCFRKYGSFPVKTNFSHELGLRILAKAVIEMGAKWNVSLIPVFAHATQHYYRIYFHHRRAHLGELLQKIGFVHYCQKCGNRFATDFRYDDKCDCRERLLHAGPLYLGNLWDKAIINKMIKENKVSAEIKDYDYRTVAGSIMGQTKTVDKEVFISMFPQANKFLEIIKNEAEADVPYFFETGEFFKIEPKKEKVYQILEKAGIKIFPTHISPKGFKTKISFKELKRILK